MYCPFCGTNDTAKCSVVHESGTTHSESAGSAFGLGGIGDDSLIFGSLTTTKGLSQTPLAARCAPPILTTDSEINGNAVVLLIVSGIVILGGLWVFHATGAPPEQGGTAWNEYTPPAWYAYIPGVLLMVAGALLLLRGIFLVGQPDARAVARNRKQRNRYAQSYDEWDKRWVCLRCGQFFAP